MTLKSHTVPALSWEQIKRVKAFCHRKRFTRDCSVYDMGYTQAQRDLEELLDSMTNEPNGTETLNMQAHRLSGEELWARKADEGRRSPGRST